MNMPIAAAAQTAQFSKRTLQRESFARVASQPCRLCRRSSLQQKHVSRCAAAEDGNSAATPATTGNIGPIKLVNDRETFQDVMAFTGPAPERVNGRLAMLAFVAVAFGELTTGKSVLEQVPTVPFRIAFVSFLISVASILPKYSAGVSLQDITEAASREGLPPQLKFFNKTHEVWLGRVAMLGFTGLIIVELFLGGALFKR